MAAIYMREAADELGTRFMATFRQLIDQLGAEHEARPALEGLLGRIQALRDGGARDMDFLRAIADIVDTFSRDDYGSPADNYLRDNNGSNPVVTNWNQQFAAIFQRVVQADKAEKTAASGPSGPPGPPPYSSVKKEWAWFDPPPPPPPAPGTTGPHSLSDRELANLLLGNLNGILLDIDEEGPLFKDLNVLQQQVEREVEATGDGGDDVLTRVRDAVVLWAFEKSRTEAGKFLAARPAEYDGVDNFRQTLAEVNQRVKARFERSRTPAAAASTASPDAAGASPAPAPGPSAAAASSPGEAGGKERGEEDGGGKEGASSSPASGPVKSEPGLAPDSSFGEMAARLMLAIHAFTESPGTDLGAAITNLSRRLISWTATSKDKGEDAAWRAASQYHQKDPRHYEALMTLYNAVDPERIEAYNLFTQFLQEAVRRTGAAG